MIDIKKASFHDHDSIWDIIKPVITSGDTYAFDPATNKEKMLEYWCGKDKHCFIAIQEGVIIGTFIIKDNHPSLGAHVANASYMVHPDHQGNGIGYEMANSSLEMAKSLGYEAMQFNLVVKTNEAAVKLWNKLGFEIIGEIPNAFKHQSLGLVNAYIMYKEL